MRCSHSSSERVIFRKIPHTLIEGTRARRTYHWSENANGECTRQGHAAVHSTVRFFVRGHLRTAAAPSVWRQQQRPQPGDNSVGEVERGRSLCAVWASLVSVTMMAASGRAETDVLVMLYMLIVAWTPCAHS